MGDIALMSTEAVKRDSTGNGVIKHIKSKKLEGRVDIRDQLLPGIPNEITLEHVASKLPWTAFKMLSLVSHGWQQAIQSHQVYDARVRAQSMQTLVVMNHNHVNRDRGLALFSISDGSCYHLPPIPGVYKGVPSGCQCISLDGKLYALGGLEAQPSAKVYVLDLAGQRHWKQCASMGEPRAHFGCSVISGKIYVFGGTASWIGSWTKPVYCGSEVYDPKSDAWFPIAPMNHPGLYLHVVALGEELFVCNTFRNSDFSVPSLKPMQVYSPLKNQWRTVDHSVEVLDILLMVGGKLHKLGFGGIHVFDTGLNSWIPSQSFSFGDSMGLLLAAVVVDDEVLGLANLIKRNDDMGNTASGICLIRSQGLGRLREKIEWQKAECSLSFENVPFVFLCPIQL